MNRVESKNNYNPHSCVTLLGLLMFIPMLSHSSYNFINPHPMLSLSIYDPHSYVTSLWLLMGIPMFSYPTLVIVLFNPHSYVTSLSLQFSLILIPMLPHSSYRYYHRRNYFICYYMK